MQKQSCYSLIPSTHSFVQGTHSDHPESLLPATGLRKRQANKTALNTFIYMQLHYFVSLQIKF